MGWDNEETACTPCPDVDQLQETRSTAPSDHDDLTDCQCIPGTSHNSENTKCDFCKGDTYQDQPGMSTCRQCPGQTYIPDIPEGAASTSTPRDRAQLRDGSDHCLTRTTTTTTTTSIELDPETGSAKNYTSATTLIPLWKPPGFFDGFENQNGFLDEEQKNKSYGIAKSSLTFKHVARINLQWILSHNDTIVQSLQLTFNLTEANPVHFLGIYKAIGSESKSTRKMETLNITELSKTSARALAEQSETSARVRAEQSSELGNNNNNNNNNNNATIIDVGTINSVGFANQSYNVRQLQLDQSKDTFIVEFAIVLQVCCPQIPQKVQVLESGDEEKIREFEVEFCRILNKLLQDRGENPIFDLAEYLKIGQATINIIRTDPIEEVGAAVVGAVAVGAPGIFAQKEEMGLCECVGLAFATVEAWLYANQIFLGTMIGVVSIWVVHLCLRIVSTQKRIHHLEFIAERKKKRRQQLMDYVNSDNPLRVPERISRTIFRHRRVAHRVHRRVERSEINKLVRQRSHHDNTTVTKEEIDLLKELNIKKKASKKRLPNRVNAFTFSVSRKNAPIY